MICGDSELEVWIVSHGTKKVFSPCFLSLIMYNLYMVYCSPYINSQLIIFYLYKSFILKYYFNYNVIGILFSKCTAFVMKLVYWNCICKIFVDLFF